MGKIKFKEVQVRHGLTYTLLDRNEFVALIEVSATYSIDPIQYEVIKIYHRKPNRYEKYLDKHTIIECMPSDEIFGRDKSRSYNNLEAARQYYEELSCEYKMNHETIVSIKGRVQNDQDINLLTAA